MTNCHFLGGLDSASIPTKAFGSPSALSLVPHPLHALPQLFPRDQNRAATVHKTYAAAKATTATTTAV
jgi:hypothetical protein